MCMLANQRPYNDIFWAYNLTLAHHNNPVRGDVSRDDAAARFQPLGTMFCSVYFWQKMHKAAEGRSCQTGASLRCGGELRPHARVSKTAACMAAPGGVIASSSLKGSVVNSPVCLIPSHRRGRQRCFLCCCLSGRWSAGRRGCRF